MGVSEQPGAARARPRAATQRIDVIGIVASAGGLEALGAVLGALPKGVPAAVVVGQHLGSQGSALVEILARRTALPVAWARQGEPVATGAVTVCPPRSTLEVLPDRTCAVAPAPNPAAHQLDVLLLSLAASIGPAAAAVVLTGMGNDGAAGAAAIGEAGGLVIAQSEETAQHPGMPRAAVLAGGVDLVLPLYDIGPALIDALAGRELPLARAERDAIATTFGEEGAIAALARETDWAATSLGPVRDWPAAQRVAVRLAMDAPDGAALYLGPDHLQLFNEAFLASLGGGEAQAFARPFAESHPGMVEHMLPVLARVLAGTRVQHVATLTPLERDGRLEDAWFDMSYTPVRNAQGDVIGVSRSLRERTDQVLAARRLEALNRLATAPPAGDRREALEAALAALGEAPDVPFAAAYLLDAEGGQAHLAGVAGAVGGGMAPGTVRLTASAVWPLAEVVRGRAPVLLEDLAARFGGRPAGAPERALLYPLRDEAGGTVAGVLILGVTPRLPLDARFREFLVLAGEAVVARVAEAHARRRERRRLERLAELERAKTEFFSNISHEFRTPLTLMLGPLEAALDRPQELPEALRGQLEIVYRNARRLLRLTGALLDFSQMEAGRLHAHLMPTDLARQTRDVVAQFERAAARAGIALRADVRPLAEPVWVDAGMWEKIVANLLSNALKFTWEGDVEVSLRQLARHAELVVRDTGVGIPDEELPYIFARFHRVPQTRGRTQEGAGIGLALVDELVRRHGGRTRVTSAVGSGTTVTVWIPMGWRPTQPGDQRPSAEGPGTGVAAALAEEAARWDRASGAAEGESPIADATPDPGHDGLRSREPGARLLVADGNADMRDHLRRTLGARWAVTTARDGEEALRLARRDPPDLLVADVTMPGLDGFGLLGQLRADPALEAVPVILLTARAGEEAAIEGLLAGADDYVVKPFSAREMLARVGGQLELARVRRQTDRRFRALAEAMWDVVYRMSPDWSEMQALTGRGFIPDTDVPSTSWLGRYIHPADQAEVLRAVRAAIDGRRPFELEHRVRRPDGSLGWTLSRAVPILDDAGGIVEWVGAAMDVTARHAADDALREDGERRRSLVASLAEATWDADPAGLVVEDSPSWCALTGQSPEDRLGDGWLDAVHPDDRAEAGRRWREAVAARRPVDLELQLRHAASGGWRRASLRAVPLPGEDGAVRGWAAAVVGSRGPVAARSRPARDRGS